MKIGDYNYDNDLIDLTIQDRQTRHRVYRVDRPMVVIGHGSKPDVELNLETVIKDGVPVVKRRGGGCAVVLDQGNVIVSIVLPTKGLANINEYFKSISDRLIQGLEKTGVNGVHHEGISDIVIGDRKIAGACMQRKRDYIYYSASILVSPDIDLMERYLEHPPREPEYRRHRVHRDFVGTLEYLSNIDDIKKFEIDLNESLNKNAQSPL